MVFKFIKRQVRTVGFRRFSFAASLILAGLVWKFVQLGGGSVEIAAKKALSFWPIFWAVWMGSGLVLWMASGFKNIGALLFGLIGGGFMAETVLPGVVINSDNMPLFFILTGLLVLMGRRISAGGNAYSYGSDGGGYFGGYFGKKDGGSFNGKTMLKSWFGGKSARSKHSHGSKRKHSSRSNGIGPSIEVEDDINRKKSSSRRGSHPRSNGAVGEGGE